MVKNIPVGYNPIYIAARRDVNRIYVANSFSNDVSVIDTNTNAVVKNIPVGDYPTAVALSMPRENHYPYVYVANTRSHSVSVIDGTTNAVVKNIPVGTTTDLSFDYASATLYVVNSVSNDISVIDTNTNSVVKNITNIGKFPSHIASNPNTNTIYVVNSGSDSVSVVDGVTNKVVAGVKFDVNPSNSGHIICNNIDSPTNRYLYVWSGTTCIAKPYDGFEFSSWIENLNHNSTRTIKTITSVDSPLNSLLNALHLIAPNDTAAAFSITQFGNFTANFKAIPAPLPPEYWIPLYGVIVSSVVGWSIPTIISWIKAKRQEVKVHHYHNGINSLYDDGKLDENDIKSLDKLKTDVADAYAKGKISDQHYTNLKQEISGTL